MSFEHWTHSIVAMHEGRRSQLVLPTNFLIELDAHKMRYQSEVSSNTMPKQCVKLWFLLLLCKLVAWKLEHISCIRIEYFFKLMIFILYDFFKILIPSTFSLKKFNFQFSELPAHLYGITHYGDNIEDEWFIVFLLMRLTENMPGLVARYVFWSFFKALTSNQILIFWPDEQILW